MFLYQPLVLCNNWSCTLYTAFFPKTVGLIGFQAVDMWATRSALLFQRSSYLRVHRGRASVTKHPAKVGQTGLPRDMSQEAGRALPREGRTDPRFGRLAKTVLLICLECRIIIHVALFRFAVVTLH